MTLGTTLDVVLVVFLALCALAGLRRGLLLTVVAAAGFIAGAALGLWLLPDRIAALIAGGPPLLRPLLLVAGVMLLASIAQGLAVRLASGAAHRLGKSPLGALDAVLGAALTLAVAAATTWFVAGTMRVVVPGELARGVGQSRVVTAIGTVMPASSEAVLGSLKATLDEYGFPRVFSSIDSEPIRPVPAVDDAAVATPQIRQATRSVLRIDADAPSCSRAQEGTGWVYQQGLVVTNAHVVAGSQGVRVRSGGSSLTARVVVFDPAKDLAVLSVDGLGAAPLALGRPLGHGDSAVVAGYPLGGPLKVDAARVREVLQARGDDIYGHDRVQREVYSLLATVQPGNSGGPLLAPDGTVSGVLFARSLDDARTGYALTLDEARPVLQQASRTAGAVGTGPCTAAA
ncbi:MAG: MarP family serine protease [Austwickia sp.]|nr:MAG: MarP family serine protease [Austwickia sp.]